MDPFSVAAIGYVIKDAVKVALRAFNQGQAYFSSLETTTKTLDSLAPLASQMIGYNQLLGQPNREIQTLQNLIREGQDLVQIAPKTWWDSLSFPYYQRRLQAGDNDLRRHLSVNMQAQDTANLMKVMVDVEQILKILLDNFGQYQWVQIRGVSGPPEEPNCCMGMNDHLSKLRMGLLQKDGASALVLTGLGGSGKSTLAKKICRDRQVTDKFGTNIFFVTFSKTPNVKNIVKTLFENCGCKVPEFQNDEDAINRLGVLLRLVGRNPLLLVLDDVWDNSEALIEKFKIQMSDYKILVTSRFSFQGFGTPLELEPLGHDDAMSLFRHAAQLNGSSSYMPQNNLVDEIVKSCKGSPLALEVIGGSLRSKRLAVWQNMKERLQTRKILESTDLVCRLQQSLDTLEETLKTEESLPKKECFVDLGLFPEDQRIPITTLIDMWAELHSLDDNGTAAMTIVDDFTTRNLVKLIETRKVAEDEDMHYNNHFIMLHDQLRVLAAHESNQEPFEQRKKLSIELYGDERPEWWVEQNQQGTLGRMLSLIPRWLIGQKGVAAQVLSISTDESFASDWCDMRPYEAEVLILNLCSSQYSMPHFIDKMRKLRVLIVTNYGFHLSELNKFELLGSLLNLKRIRLENVSVPSLCMLKNLQKLSLHMCNTRQAFDENSSIQISDAMPNLVEMSIDYCKDLKKLPDGVCDIISLEKLSITNCHKLSALPRDIAKLKNLEVLRLSCCSYLEEMPESVVELGKLRCLDMSDCLSLAKLPENIGELQSLKKLYMKGCQGLSEVPFSVRKFEELNHEIFVFCDDERAGLWEPVGNIPNLKIVIRKEDIGLHWLSRVRP